MRELLSRTDDLTSAERAALAELSRVVYPPAEWADWPGREIEWADAEWGVRIFDDEGSLVSYTGIVLRDALADGQPVRIGGVGGIKTHPRARGRGYARRGIELAHECFLREGADFALLVCEPHLVAYYASLGWEEFEGTLLVRQRGETVPFTFNRVMTRPVRIDGPRRGVIDLCGGPW
jgi:aminoglycoside 2'-N-acetyltransferase I